MNEIKPKYHGDLKVSADNAVRYGNIVNDYSDENTRIRLINWENNLYWHRMKDGEVIEFYEVFPKE